MANAEMTEDQAFEMEDQLVGLTEDQLKPFWALSGDGETLVEQPHQMKPSNMRAGLYSIQTNMVGQLVLQPQKLAGDEVYEFSTGMLPAVMGEVAKFWAAAPRYARLGLSHKRSMLLEGPPGCGKSRIIQQLIKKVVEAGGVAFEVERPDQFMGLLAKFRRLEPTMPIVAILEDVDDMCGNGWERPLLSLLDSAVSNADNILYVMTTNHKDRIPARMRCRPSRISKVLHVGYPDKQQLLEYGGLVTQNLPADIAPILKELVELAPPDQFSFDDLKEAITSVYVLEEKPSDIIARITEAKGLNAAASDEKSEEEDD